MTALPTMRFSARSAREPSIDFFTAFASTLAAGGGGSDGSLDVERHEASDDLPSEMSSVMLSEMVNKMVNKMVSKMVSEDNLT